MQKLNLFKKIVFTVTLCLYLPIAMSAGNIRLEKNVTNCKKIDGYGTNDIMAIANSFKVSMSSIRFMGAQWGLDQYGVNQDCLMIFDTSAGPKKCPVIKIMSDDGGKTAFASVDPFNVGKAHLCY